MGKILFSVEGEPEDVAYFVRCLAEYCVENDLHVEEAAKDAGVHMLASEKIEEFDVVHEAEPGIIKKSSASGIDDSLCRVYDPEPGSLRICVKKKGHKTQRHRFRHGERCLTMCNKDGMPFQCLLPPGHDGRHKYKED